MHPPQETIRLADNWQVTPVPLTCTDIRQCPETEWQAVPECTHLQLALHPDRPYWGDHLRHINESAWFYRYTLPDLPAHLDRWARLRFEAVDYYASVWFNGHALGQHEGNFAPFECDVTPYVQADRPNEVLVRVSAPWDPPNPHGTYPSDHVVRGMVKGLYEHGEGVIPPNVNPLGIWRPVWLILDNGVHFEPVSITTECDGSTDITFTLVQAAQTVQTGQLRITIEPENFDGRAVTLTVPVNLQPGRSTITQRVHIPDVRLWWPWDQGEPNLYALHADLLNEQGTPICATQAVFGVRTVRLDRSPERFVYYINERPVYIRGTSYVPDLYLSRCTTATLARDIDLAQQANLNLLRMHFHVAPPEAYDLCDRRGMLVWQDFELNWIHDPSPAFERRALAVQHDMIGLLRNHPSIITWACHNEPTMVVKRRQNLEQRPDPALYAAAQAQDPTRPVFICSGQMEQDWQRSGDVHSYYGAIWSRRYTDVYRHPCRLNTEFGFETPAAAVTLRQYPDVWQRLSHLEGQITALWAYQAALTQYHVEHFRRLRAAGCAGYVQFWLADLVPQVGCGVLDSARIEKGGYAALKQASQPLHIALEHDGTRPVALWAFNDTPQEYPGCTAQVAIFGADGAEIEADTVACDVPANTVHLIAAARWQTPPDRCARIELTLFDHHNQPMSHNAYDRPFQPWPRPAGYPWKFDFYLGTKVFDRPDAPSLADVNIQAPIKWIPLGLREQAAERLLRQRWPPWLLSRLARVVDAIMG